MPDDDRAPHWTWLVAGACVVVLLGTRRGRFWLADRLIDGGDDATACLRPRAVDCSAARAKQGESLALRVHRGAAHLGSSGTSPDPGAGDQGPAPGTCSNRVGGLCGTIVRQKECEGGSLCQVLELRA